jgi:hypothetical protein
MSEGLEPLAESTRRRLAQSGLDLVGVASASAYDAIVPETHRLATIAPDVRSAIVIGNGGRAFWHAFQRGSRRWSLHPLDAFTRRVVTEALDPLPPGARLVFPFDWPGTPVSFVHLAECAGLGKRSLLGVLVHPEYGPWMALRAAVLLPDVLAPTPSSFDPCPTCVERACIPACPAGAVGDGGWDVPRCMAWRLRPVDDCATGCHARIGCVIGREHRYPPEAMAFHQRSARATMGALSRRS